MIWFNSYTISNRHLFSTFWEEQCKIKTAAYEFVNQESHFYHKGMSKINILYQRINKIKNEKINN